jgi:hypothetical protein
MMSETCPLYPRSLPNWGAVVITVRATSRLVQCSKNGLKDLLSRASNFWSLPEAGSENDEDCGTDLVCFRDQGGKPRHVVLT